MPLSKLLIDNILVGNKFKFSNGAGCIINALEEVNEDVLIYFDLVPDNKNTFEQLLRQIEFIEQQFKYKTYIIPIICLEYTVTRFISKVLHEKEIKGYRVDELTVGDYNFEYKKLYELNKNKMSL